MCLISLAFLFELTKPTFRYFTRDSVDHPLGKTAHDIQTGHKEHLCHVLLQFLVESTTEHEPDYNEIGSDSLALLWHFDGIGWKAFNE